MTDYIYKTDNQIIMLALLDLLNNKRDETTIEIAYELLKRAKEQRQHIPFHIRTKTEGSKINSNIKWDEKGME